MIPDSIPQEKLIEMSMNSDILSLVLLNGKIVISYVHEKDNKLVLLSPMYIEYQTNEQGQYVYRFAPHNPFSNRAIAIMDKEKVLWANLPDIHVQLEYIKKVTEIALRIMDKNNVIESNGTIH